MNKKGFTLVELLAVIAILAILVIIALPNVMGMFNSAKKSSFTTELKEVYKVAQNQWIMDSLTSTGEKVYARSKTQTCTKSLDLSGRTELEYYIKIDKSGKVLEFYATDGTYQFTHGGDLSITDINDVNSVAELSNDQKISISCSGIGNSSSSTSENAIIVDNVNIGEFDGDYTIETDSQNHHYLKILSSGTFKPATSYSTNVFLVGGGQSGNYGVGNVGGTAAGGRGGEIITSTISLVQNQNYQIVIGQKDEDTTAFGLIAHTSLGAQGGTRGNVVCNSRGVDGSPAEDGQYAFNDSTIDGIKYGAGGGGGGYHECGQTGRGGAAGNTGGGSAGVANSSNGSGGNATPNTGSGGGAGSTWWDGQYVTNYLGGAGASGIVIIKLD